MLILLALTAYFCILSGISRLVARRSSNETFFRGGCRSPWYMVAFGMVGASISAVTFVSVPGMVLTSSMAYLQLCMGFVLGYVAVAFVLLPVYYKLNQASIYSFLGERLGRSSHLSGAWFFLGSKLAGAALKFYVVCTVMQRMVMDSFGVPFVVTVLLLVLVIWLYTRRGGIRTLVFTDVFQTLCLFTALVLIIRAVLMDSGCESVSDAVGAIMADERSRVFVLDDWSSPWLLWKQLLSGLFIVVVMTGLDQDMMQKNLTCRTLHEAQKSMCIYGLAFLPANLLFLSLGILLAQLYGGSLPASGDDLLPLFVANSGVTVAVLFTIGIVSASFSSADSALTSLTTCYCVDISGKEGDESLRRRCHGAMCIAFALFILLCHAVNSKSLIDAIYTMVAYTYGPLLGLFAFALFTRRKADNRLVPFVCIASPLLSFAIDQAATHLFAYHFGYELLLLNGMLCYVGLRLTSHPPK